MECRGAVEGVHEDHCLHDLRRSDAAARLTLKDRDPREGPGQICCWCGDLFLSRSDNGNSHGEYEPGIAVWLRKKREASGRKEARMVLRENRLHVKSHGQGFLSDKEVKDLEAVVAWPKRKLNHVCPECGKPKSRPVVCRGCRR